MGPPHRDVDAGLSRWGVVVVVVVVVVVAAVVVVVVDVHEACMRREMLIEKW